LTQPRDFAIIARIEDTGNRLTTIDDAHIDGVRWLAESILPEGHAGLDLPASPIRVGPECNPPVREYLLQWARHPQAGGDFDVKTRWLRSLPDALLLRTLFDFGYSGLVYMDGPKVIGHIFDQRHTDTLHVFSLGLSDPFDSHHHAHVSVMDFVAYASQRSDIAAVRLGRGRKIRHAVLERVREHEERLGWRVGDDGWIEFSRSRRCDS